jgi:hypothetical protein
MSTLSRLTQRFGLASRSSRSGNPHGRPFPGRSRRLGLEVLEDRLSPATLTVNSTADTANPSDPYLSLREAIAIVNSPTLPSGLSDQILARISGTLHGLGADTIQFDPSGVTGPIVLGGTQLELSLRGSTASVTIDGGSGVTIDGASRSRVLQVDSGVQATLDQLTITHGNAPGGGYGGGIYNGGTLTVSHSTLSANSASQGGGIYNAGRVTVSDSTLSFNSTSSSVGALAGGGLYNEGGTVTVSNSTLSGNSAVGTTHGPGFGGGIANYIGPLTVSNSTLSANSASSQGGGIFNSFGTVRLQDTIVAGNRSTADASPDISGNVTAPSSHNLVGNGNGLSGISNGLDGNLVGTAVTPIDPRLGPLLDNGGPTLTHALLPDSPARGAGSLDSAPATDQRGLPRTTDGEIDLGSYQTPTAVAGPQVALSDPGGVIDPPVDHVRLTFNHPLDPDSVTADPFSLSGPTGAVPVTGVTAVDSSDDQQFDVWFPSQTDSGNYALAVGAGLRDSHGTPQNGPQTTRFIVFGPGSVLTVNSTADTANPNDPYLTLREALAIVNSPSLPDGLSPQIQAQIQGTLHANGSDTIVFDPTRMTGPIRLGGAQLEVSFSSRTARLRIDGGSGVTVDGNNASRVLQVDGGVQAILDHLTISHGRIVGNGGGILNAGALVLTNSTLSSNSASGYGGGGISNIGGTLTVSSSTLSSNSAEFGGGISSGAGTLTVSNSALFAGSAYYGGGIYNFLGTVTVSDSTLSANSAVGGGAIWHSSDHGTVTVSHSTLSANSAANWGGISSYGTMGLQDTIVAGNRGQDINGYSSQTHCLIGGDPRLAPLGFYGGPTPTMPLLPGSPARGAGDPASAGTTDQRGLPRRPGEPIDIGAFQTQPDPFVVTTLADPGRLSGSLSLREAVALANVLPGDDTVSFADDLGGGAVLLTAGQLELSGSGGLEAIDGAGRFTLDGNASTRLVQVDPGTRAALRGLALVNGNAGAGAGVHNRGTLAIADCVLYGNTGYAGGAVLNQGDLTVWGSTLAFNVATLGAALDNEGLLTAYNSTLLYNAALESGGGILNQPTGTATLTSLTISRNSADSGGGLDVAGGEVSLRNCIVAGNYTADAGAASDIAGVVAGSSSYNLIGVGGSGGLLAGVGHNLVGVADPGLTDPDFDTSETAVFGFRDDSPALGAGDPSLLDDPVLRLDQHGNPRTVVNIGAV